MSVHVPRPAKCPHDRNSQACYERGCRSVPCTRANSERSQEWARQQAPDYMARHHREFQERSRKQTAGGRRIGQEWTREEDRYLRYCADMPKMDRPSDTEQALHLGRSRTAVSTRKQKLGLQKRQAAKYEEAR